MQGTQVWSLGQEDPLEKEMANHSSILAQKIPWTEEPGGLQSMGSQRVRHNWAIKQQEPVMCHKNHIITDQKYRGNSYPCYHPSGKSRINVPFSGRGSQGYPNPVVLEIDQCRFIPESSHKYSFNVSQRNHLRRSQMAHEKLKNHRKICVRKVDTTKAGWSRSRYFSGLVIFKMRGLDYNNMGLSSSLSIKSGRFYLRTGLWRLNEKGEEHFDQWCLSSDLSVELSGRMYVVDCHSE